MGATRVINVGIECPHCLKTTPHSLAQVAVVNNVACSDCGGTINLEAGNNAILIEELLKACGRIDAALAKRRNGK